MATKSYDPESLAFVVDVVGVIEPFRRTKVAHQQHKNAARNIKESIKMTWAFGYWRRRYQGISCDGSGLKGWVLTGGRLTLCKEPELQGASKLSLSA